MGLGRKEGKENDGEGSGESRRRSILQTLSRQPETSRPGDRPGETNKGENEGLNGALVVQYDEGESEAQAGSGKRQGRLGCGDWEMNKGEDQDRRDRGRRRLEGKFPSFKTPQEEQQSDRENPASQDEPIHHLLPQGPLDEKRHVHQEEGHACEDEEVDSRPLPPSAGFLNRAPQVRHEFVKPRIRSAHGRTMIPMNQAEGRFTDAFAELAEGTSP